MGDELGPYYGFIFIGIFEPFLDLCLVNFLRIGFVGPNLVAGDETCLEHIPVATPPWTSDLL